MSQIIKTYSDLMKSLVKRIYKNKMTPEEKKIYEGAKKGAYIKKAKELLEKKGREDGEMEAKKRYE